MCAGATQTLESEAMAVEVGAVEALAVEEVDPRQ
jgi:hypothetical protein